MKKNLSKALALLLILVAAIGLASLLADRIRPVDRTETNMVAVKHLIVTYFNENRSLPSSLTQLAQLAGYDDKILLDGWKNPIAYSHNSEGIVTLTSLGAPANAGQSTHQIIRKFRVCMVPNCDSDQFGPWID